MTLNEVTILNNLISIIREDLLASVEVLKGKTSTELSSHLRDKLDYIINDRVPLDWHLNGFVNSSRSLFEFVKSLLLKKDFVLSLVYARKCHMFPIIPLYKMSDPLTLLHSFMWYYSKENSV